MDREKATDGLMNCVNILILLMIAVLYVATGTRLGDNAIAVMQNGVYRGGKNGSVALACSVIWDAEHLTDMLDTLEESGVRMTFFVSGEWAKEHASTLRRMAEDGHEIGTSGYAPLLDGSVETVMADVSASARIIDDIAGGKTELYYAGLRAAEVSQRACEAAGLRHIAGSADLLSARGEAEDIVARVFERAFDGCILLMQPTGQAVEALPDIMKTVVEMGYGIKPVGSVIDAK